MTSLWIPVLGASLLQFLWQAAAVAILVLAAQPLLRGRSANARYLVNSLALFSLPILFAATIAHYAAAAPSLSGAAGAGPLLRQFAPWLVALWITGIAVCGLYTLAGWTWAQLLRRATTAVPPAFKAEATRLAALLRVNVSVRLQFSSRVAGPCTLGWLRPIILLPVSAATSLTPDQLTALLAHELAHIRRHDYLVNLAQRAVEVVFFFHPAVWWLSRQVSEEREHCCDDLAISVCGNPSAYARTLVDLAALQSAARSMPAAALAATGGSLSHRVTRLLGSTASRRPAWRTTIALILIASTGIWLLGASAAQPVTPPPSLPSAPIAPAVKLALVPLVQSLPAPQRASRAASVSRTRSPNSPVSVPLAPRAAYVTFSLRTVQACTTQQVWVPERTPSGVVVLRPATMSQCVPVVTPVEVLVMSSL